MRDIISLLACPKCKGCLKIDSCKEDELGLIDGNLTCLECGEVYLLRNGVFHFDIPLEYESESETEWKREVFEDTYKSFGYYESTKEYAMRVGAPEAVIDYDYPKVKGRLLEWLNPGDSSIILDVGCGVGYFIFQMLHKYSGLNMTLIGIDISESNVGNLAYRKRKERKSQVYSALANSEALAFQDGVFDRITCTEVLEHVFRPEMAIKEISRVLKKGGIALISTPSGKAADFWQGLLSPLVSIRDILRRKVIPRKETRDSYGVKINGSSPYDKPLKAMELRTFLESSGFQILDFEFNVLIPPQSLFRYIPKVLVNPVLKLCGFIERKRNTGMICRSLGLHMVVRARKI